MMKTAAIYVSIGVALALSAGAAFYMYKNDSANADTFARLVRSPDAGAGDAKNADAEARSVSSQSDLKKKADEDIASLKHIFDDLDNGAAFDASVANEMRYYVRSLDSYLVRTGGDAQIQQVIHDSEKYIGTTSLQTDIQSHSYETGTSAQGVDAVQDQVVPPAPAQGDEPVTGDQPAPVDSSGQPRLIEGANKY